MIQKKYTVLRDRQLGKYFLYLQHRAQGLPPSQHLVNVCWLYECSHVRTTLNLSSTVIKEEFSSKSLEKYMLSHGAKEPA